MKRLFLLLIFGILLINLGVLGFADNCELATPRYGVVQCINTGQKETLNQNFNCGSDDDLCSIQTPCLSNCQLTSFNWGSGSCPFGYPHYSEIWLNGVQMADGSAISWSRGDNLLIKAGCKNVLTGSFKPIYPSYPNAKVMYQQDQIMLEEGWAGSLPDTPVSGTEGCVVNQNFGESDISSYLDPQTGQTVTKPDSSYSLLTQFPNNWKINDHLIFVKDWQTGVADISLTYDKNNKGYWCGGQYGSRKIYNVQEITTPTGKCYDIPQSISLSNAECCFPSDCVSKGAEYTCNPEDWKCEQTKPCNSQIDCDQTFGAGVCQDNQINQWVCDLTKKWGNNAGTCVHSAKAVTNCPSDCNNKQYYNEEQGKCLTREGIVIENNINASDTSGFSSSDSQRGSSTGIIILFVFLVIIAVAIGFFIYAKRKKNNHPPIKTAEQDKVKSSGKHCTKCGSILKEGSKFCTKCGHKLK